MDKPNIRIVITYNYASNKEYVRLRLKEIADEIDKTLNYNAFSMEILPKKGSDYGYERKG